MGLLTDAQLTDCRRFCGYGMIGDQPPAFMTGYRFFTAYGVLEFRMLNLSVTEAAVVSTYLTQLNIMEVAIAGAGANLDTASAAVWTHNKNEIADREKLYLSFRRKLVQFLGLELGPFANDATGIASCAVEV